MLGIGGGMIMGPLFLELGMNSKTTSATSAASVFISASSATVQFLILDTLLKDYSIWFFAWGFLATLAGHELLRVLMKKFKRLSFIIISILLVLVLDCSSLWRFCSFCSTKPCSATNWNKC